MQLTTPKQADPRPKYESPKLKLLTYYHVLLVTTTVLLLTCTLKSNLPIIYNNNTTLGILNSAPKFKVKMTKNATYSPITHCVRPF